MQNLSYRIPIPNTESRSRSDCQEEIKAAAYIHRLSAVVADVKNLDVPPSLAQPPAPTAPLPPYSLLVLTHTTFFQLAVKSATTSAARGKSKRVEADAVEELLD